MTLTSWLTTSGWAQLSPLCPGSSTITWPASGRAGAVALGDGAPAEAAPAGELAGPPGPELPPSPDAALDAGSEPPEQAASTPARAAAAANAATARTGPRRSRTTARAGVRTPNSQLSHARCRAAFPRDDRFRRDPTGAGSSPHNRTTSQFEIVRWARPGRRHVTATTLAAALERAHNLDVATRQHYRSEIQFATRPAASVSSQWMFARPPVGGDGCGMANLTVGRSDPPGRRTDSGKVPVLYLSARCSCLA